MAHQGALPPAYIVSIAPICVKFSTRHRQWKREPYDVAPVDGHIVWECRKLGARDSCGRGVPGRALHTSHKANTERLYEINKISMYEENIWTLQTSVPSGRSAKGRNRWPVSISMFASKLRNSPRGNFVLFCRSGNRERASKCWSKRKQMDQKTTLAPCLITHQRYRERYRRLI